MFDVTITAEFSIGFFLLVSFFRCPRPSDPWFNAECRYKIISRRLRWARIAAVRDIEVSANVSAAASLSLLPSPPTEAAWHKQLSRYRELLNQKRTAYWQSKIEADQHSPNIL